jgi:hypothetical protein
MKSLFSMLMVGSLLLALGLSGFAQQNAGNQKTNAQTTAKKTGDSCDRSKDSCCNKKDSKGKHECPMAEEKPTK